MTGSSMTGAVLILDSALGACTVVAARDGAALAARHEVMARGHQERLGGLARDVMAEAGLTFETLDAVGVTVGPGSFTGLRVGLAFAQGLGLALDRPVVGLSTLAALAEDASTARAAGVVDARRGQVYWQAFEGGRPLDEPRALDLTAGRDAARALGPGATLVGSGAPLIGAETDVTTLDRPGPSPEALIRAMARAPAGAARPLYLRAADAKPPKAWSPG